MYRQVCQTYKYNARRLRMKTSTQCIKKDESQATADVITWGGRLPSRRRLLVGTSVSTGITLGANFGGITSKLLGLVDEETVEKYGLDVLYSRNGYRRCLDRDNGYTFLVPEKWLSDQLLYQRYAKRIEQRNPLDPPPINRRNTKKNAGVEPVAAYGPPGGNGEKNASVVVAPIDAGFTLQSLGPPDQAATLILNNFIAPENSQKVAQLIQADSRRGTQSEIDAVVDYYVLEYRVTSLTQKWTRHNISVYGTMQNLLYTLNIQCPEKEWEAEEHKLRKIAESFKII